MQKNKKNHWPYTITALILFMVLACVITVKSSLSYPVEDDFSYFDTYQNVENNFNEIQISQENFLKLFDVKIQLDKKIKLKNMKKDAYVFNDKINFMVENLQPNINMSLLKIKAKIVRPHTTKEDFVPQVLQNNKNISINAANLQKGRWQLMIEFSYKQLKFFQRIELFKE